MKLTFDVDSMTLGEVEEFEELTGLSLEDLMSGRRTTKAMSTLIYLQERRTNPEYTIEDARALKISELTVEDAPDPTPAADAT